MKKALFLALVSLAILNFNCATQQPYVSGEKCDAPVWHDGDSWKFIGGGNRVWEERFIGSKLTQTPQKGFYAIFNVPFIGLRIFPLWVGKRVEGAQQAKTVEGYDLMYQYSFRVIGIEDLKIEAGTFKVYKIEFKLFSSIHREEGVAYYYYAPETKSIVKFETRSRMLYKWEDYELSSFNVKGLTPKASMPDFKPPPPNPEFGFKSPPPGVNVISKPELSVGDTWIFKTDKGELIYQIETLNDSEVIVNQGETKLFFALKEMGIVKVTSQGETIYDFIPPYRSWNFFPLWVGKTWENNYAERNLKSRKVSHFRELVEVKDWENVETPAGVFKALKIQLMRENLDTKGHWSYSVWYSPEVKYYIRKVSKDVPAWNLTLIEFRKGQ
jgi:hypothetical protein